MNKTSKMVVLILMFCISLIMLNLFVSAHSGDTDSQGGHYDYSTNEYHYHHGYPPHQHDNGNCPYEVEQTDFTKVLVKIFCFIGGAFILRFASLIPVTILLEVIEKKSPTLNEERQDKIHNILGTISYIISLVILLIVLIQW